MNFVRQQLAKALERSVADGHPWVYRDALHSRGGSVSAGALVELTDRRGRFLARGIADAGPIGLRIWTMRKRAIDQDLFLERIRSSLALRESLPLADTTALRWVHGEADRMPGFVCDRYGEHLVVAWDGEGIQHHAERILGVLAAEARGAGISSISVKEGRGKAKTLQSVVGQPPDGVFEVRERGMRMLVDLKLGQKTGLFLDHRESRADLRARANGRRVLNLYGYTGGFSIAAGLGGAAQVTTVDQSGPAIELACEGWARNGLKPEVHEGVSSDVRSFLEARAQDRAPAYDIVVADPPSFAPNRKSVDRALDAYRKLHRAAMLHVEPGGLYLAASCSAHVGRIAFEQSLRDGARDCKRHLQVLGRWGAGADHPVPLGFPEGDYLTVCLCRVLER